MLSLSVLLLFPVAMMMSTFNDILSMKIPNYVPLALLAGFAVLAPIGGMGWATLGSHVGVAAIVFFIGYILFAMNRLGAGDVKLAFLTAFWLGPSASALYFAYAGIIGGIAAIILLQFRSAIYVPEACYRIPFLKRLYTEDVGLPYAVALGPAGLLAFSDSPWFKLVAFGTPIG